MTQRISRLAAASALVLLAISSAAVAKSPADIHAYFEAERARSDGQVAPAAIAHVSRDLSAARPVTSREREFLFQLSRTDGSHEPWPDDATTGGAIAGATAQAPRARAAN
jgi:hypothetical protein